MSKNISKKQSNQTEELETEESVNWIVVIPLILVMVAVFVGAFISLS